MDYGVQFSDEGLTPGFHQARLRGNKTGREAPRDAIRGTRRSEVFAAHGLMDQGAANPNQGQLFEPNKAAGTRRTPEAMAYDRGVAPPLASSKPGFMPGLERKTERGRKSAVVTGLNRLAEARTRTGADRGTGAPVREAMEDRQRLYDAGKPADWYSGVDADGSHKSMLPGKARTAIDNAALRTGTTNEKMTRAVALTSPRTAWDDGGAPGTTDHSMPNIEAAESVVRAVHAYNPKDSEDAIEIGRSIRSQALPEMQGKAADYHANVPTTRSIKVSDPASQKVPNFEQSLHLSHVDPAIQKQAAGSYTVDGWDTKGIGADEKMLKTDTGYAVAHMTGVRAALKNRELPPNFQARTWNAIRDADATGYGANPTSIGTKRLFVSKRSGELAPNPKAMPPAEEQRTKEVESLSRSLKRGNVSRAEKMGIEF